MEINTEKSKLCMWIEHIIKTKSYNCFRNQIFTNVTEELIDHYQLYKYKQINMIHNPNFKKSWLDKYKDREWDFIEFLRLSSTDKDIIDKFFTGDINYTVIPCLKGKDTRDFNELINYNYHSYIKQFSNNLLDHFVATGRCSMYFIEKYPEADWNYDLISLHVEDISYEFFKKNINKNWNYKSLSLNSCITLDWIKKHQHKDWNTLCLSNNNNFVIEWVNELHYDWCFNMLSRSKFFNIEWVKKYQMKNWDFDYLSTHCDFSFDWVYLFDKKPWNYQKLTLNSLITAQVCKKLSYNNYFSSYEYLIKNENFDIDWIKDYLINYCDDNNYHNYCDDQLCQLLSSHKNFSYEWIKKFPTLNWNVASLELSDKFDIKIIDELQFLNLNWNFNIISSNPNFKIEWVSLYPDKEWDFEQISSNPNFKIEWIEQYPNKEWNKRELSLNSNLKLESIIKYPHFFNKYYYSQNKNITQEWLTNDVNYNLKNIITNTDYIDINILKNYKFSDFKLSDIDKFEYIRNNLDYLNYDNFKVLNQQYEYYIKLIDLLERNKNWNFSWVNLYPNIQWNYSNIIYNSSNELMKELNK